MKPKKKRGRDGYKYLPQRNGKLALVKMPERPKRLRAYAKRREKALAFALNLARKYDLFDDIARDTTLSEKDAAMLAEMCDLPHPGPRP